MHHHSQNNEKPVEIDFLDLLQLMDKEISRAGMTKDQARSLCIERYGRKTRHALSDEQLIDFYRYLRSLPSKANSANPVKRLLGLGLSRKKDNWF